MDIRLYTYMILEALEFSHAHGIMHRDIKPLNILVKHKLPAVGQPLVVALSDFRCSRVLACGATKLGATNADAAEEQMMTQRLKVLIVHYKAPEVLMDETYSLPSDVWSTGITLVEVEQGHPPF